MDAPTQKEHLEVDEREIMAPAEAWRSNRGIRDLDYMIKVIHAGCSSNLHRFSANLFDALLRHRSQHLYPL